MSLAFTPHTISVQPATDPAAVSDLSTSTPTLGAAVSIDGQLVSKSAETIFQNYGVEANNGFLFLFNLPNQQYFNVGYRATYGTRIFAVRSQPKVFDAGLPTDYGSVVLDELAYV